MQEISSIDRALAIRQPFAWAVCSGAKTIENRTLGTPYRGWIGIHASQSGSPLDEIVELWPDDSPLRDEPFDRGALIGVAELVDVVPLSEELEQNPAAQGPLCWRLENGRLFQKPIPLKGKLNLFKLNAATSAEIANQLQLPAREIDPSCVTSFLEVVTDNEEGRVHMWAQSYATLGQWQDVLRCAARLIELVPDDAIGHRLSGMACLELNDLPRAEQHCREAIRLDPEDGYAWLFLGDSLNDQGQQKAAEECYLKADEWGADLGVDDETDDDGEEN